MILFLIFIFGLSCLHLATNLSLLPRIPHIVCFCLLLSVVGLVMFPFSIRINFKTLVSLFNNPDILALACTYQIVESIILMLSAIARIKAHCGEKTIFAARVVSRLPAGIFLVGIFFAETYFFNVVDCNGFWGLALLFSLGTAGTFFVCGISLRKLLPDWEWRMELSIVLSFFQIVVAMSLPLLLMGLKVQGTQFGTDAFGRVIMTWGFLLLIVFTGFYARPLLQRIMRV